MNDRVLGDHESKCLLGPSVFKSGSAIVVVRRTWSDDYLTKVVFGVLADLQLRIGHAEKRILELEQEIAVIKNGGLEQTDVDVAFRDFDTVWNTLSPREQRQLVGLLISVVEFDPDDCSIELEFHPTAIKKLAGVVG